ncbi:hypothetical protein F2Q68_00037472 [Brassica cretica]|uniref:Uncharacterized protein n=1 Tax=Brassica cretica TaxID=69181 RepID=A0A8S9H5F0_BRACR|nr:hypothetical protein F2Q68_00037472 [Brassica cretica]
MNYSENILSCDQKPSRLTRDQEHVIMVSALIQVISNVRGDDTSSSNSVACEVLHQPLDAGPCPLCNITGCYGCAFPRREEIEKETKHKATDNNTGEAVEGTDRPPSVKAAKRRGKKPMEEGKGLCEFELMWSIKQEDLSKKERLSKIGLLDRLLAKTEPLPEYEEALKKALITELFST